MIELIGDHLIPFTMVVLTFAFFVVWIVAATMDSIYKTSCNTRLKERLIARGANVEEIERIVNAGQPDAESGSKALPNRTFPPRKQTA